MLPWLLNDLHKHIHGFYKLIKVKKGSLPEHILQSAEEFISLPFEIRPKSHNCYHKILQLVCLLSHHKWTVPGFDWKWGETTLFWLSWPACFVSELSTIAVKCSQFQNNWSKWARCENTLKNSELKSTAHLYFLSILLFTFFYHEHSLSWLYHNGKMFTNCYLQEIRQLLDAY